MPATFTRAPAEVERKDPGIGGKPPLDRRPTGGGGGDENWDNHPNGRRGPRELLIKYRFLLFSALAGDFVFFLVLVIGFFAHPTAGHFDPRENYVSDWHRLAVPPILWINTAVLLLSSLTVEAARRHLFHEIDVMEEWLGLGRPAVRRAAPWLLATIVLGSMFLAGQWIGWNQLRLQGLAFSTNQNSNFFYLVTVTHAFHLVLGIFALCTALGALFTLKRVQMRQIVVDCAAWYWHTMGIFWLFIFGLLTLFQ